jgi:hypothetical protein
MKERLDAAYAAAGIQPGRFTVEYDQDRCIIQRGTRLDDVILRLTVPVTPTPEVVTLQRFTREEDPTGGQEDTDWRPDRREPMPFVMAGMLVAGLLQQRPHGSPSHAREAAGAPPRASMNGSASGCRESWTPAGRATSTPAGC